MKSQFLVRAAAAISAIFGMDSTTADVADVGPVTLSTRIKRPPKAPVRDPLYNRRAVNLLARLSSPRVGVYRHGTEVGKRWARKNRAWSGVRNPKKKLTALGWNRRAVEAQLETNAARLESLPGL